MFSSEFFVSVTAEHHQHEMEEKARQSHLVKIARERKKYLRRLRRSTPDKSQTLPENKRG